MRSGEVYRNGEHTGTIREESTSSYIFRYTDAWFNNPDKPAVSLTLPKTKQQYESSYLFPFFFNILSEGVNRKLQSRALQIDEKDDFGLLLATAQYDTIGAITIKPSIL